MKNAYSEVSLFTSIDLHSSGIDDTSIVTLTDLLKSNATVRALSLQNLKGVLAPLEIGSSTSITPLVSLVTFLSKLQKLIILFLH